MNMRQHAALAERLIKDQCGGAAVAEQVGRVGKSLLYRAMDAQDPYSLSADVICALEDYAGDGHYSAALHEASRAPGGCTDLVGDTLDLVAGAGRLAVCVHDALADDRVSERERSDLLARIEVLQATLRGLSAELDPAPRPKPGTVVPIGGAS